MKPQYANTDKRRTRLLSFDARPFKTTSTTNLHRHPPQPCPSDARGGPPASTSAPKTILPSSMTVRVLSPLFRPVLP